MSEGETGDASDRGYFAHEPDAGKMNRDTWREEGRMFEHRKKSRKRGHRRGRHGSRRKRWWGEDLWFDDEDELSEHKEDLLEAMDESLLSEDERRLRAARRLADRKVALSRQALRAAAITIPMLIFVPFFGVISLIYFSVGLGRRAFKVFYEPKLHEHFVRDEVQRQVRRRLTKERRELEGEHHRSLEQLSAAIAHEIRNPITAAKSLVQQLGEDAGDVDQEEFARVAVAELERVERSISHLLRYAREEETRISEVVMEDILESAIETFRDRASRGGIDIIRQYDVDGRLEGDPEQLRRVVINLVTNAIDALEECEVDRPEIRVTMGENLAGTEVWVRIADNGNGIDLDSRDRIFDPFYTSRENGTGLGLALCRKIVDKHHGTIEVVSPPTQQADTNEAGTREAHTQEAEGTEFVMTFPRRRGMGTEGG